MGTVKRERIRYQVRRGLGLGLGLERLLSIDPGSNSAKGHG